MDTISNTNANFSMDRGKEFGPGGGDDGADGGGSNVLSLLSGLLGGSSGGGGDGEAGGGSNVLSLLSGLLGSSSGGGGDGEDGGGSNVLSLVSGLFGSSSGGGGASVGGSVSYKGATYDDLIKQSREENSFNPISLLTNSISQVLQVGMNKVDFIGHVPAFAWGESGKPFSKITVSTPNQNQNPHIPVVRSLVQHENDALDHAATEEGSLPVQLKEVSQRMPDSSVTNLHVQCAPMCYRDSQKKIVICEQK
uniref:Uncharacterized protein n=1 Tax=Timema poppense TaxID=170557 RepID=A0A7R9GTC6_TIMPO|nr:unnamed protein product [Timema poppensis]